MLAIEECLPWDWHLFQRELKGRIFNADDLATWTTDAEGTKIEYCHVGDGAYARGALTVVGDSNEALDLPDDVIRRRTQTFADQYRQMLNGNVNGKCSTRMTLEFQVQWDGPKYRAICMVRTLQEPVQSQQQPEMASVK